MQRVKSFVIGCGLVLASACGSDSTSDATEGEVASAVVADGNGTIVGKVVRSVELSEDGDGKGTIHISIDADCRNERGTTTEPLGKLTIEMADLAAEDASVPFELTGLEDGTYFVAGWFDDVDNPDQDEVLPGTGDLAMFGDLSPRCEQVEVKDGKAKVTLELDYLMMFNLTGTMGSEGVMMGTDEEVDPSTIVDDGSVHTVTIKLKRSVEPGMGGDGEGKLFGGLSKSCFNDVTGSVPVPDYAVIEESITLAETNEPIAIEVEGVKNGVYQFNAFIDDVDNANDENPRPGIGDLVSFGGTGPSCAQVVVNGEDATVEFDLNFVMPFNL